MKQVMVTENYETWEDLFKNFPCETLKEIDRLWVQNSNNKFGITIQSKICYQERDWDKFGDRMGWRVKDRWLSYDKIISISLTQAEMTHGEEEVPHQEVAPLPVFPFQIYLKVEAAGHEGWLVSLSYNNPIWCERFGNNPIWFGNNQIWRDVFSRAKTCKV